MRAAYPRKVRRFGEYDSVCFCDRCVSLFENAIDWPQSICTYSDAMYNFGRLWPAVLLGFWCGHGFHLIYSPIFLKHETTIHYRRTSFPSIIAFIAIMGPCGPNGRYVACMGRVFIFFFGALLMVTGCQYGRYYCHGTYRRLIFIVINWQYWFDQCIAENEKKAIATTKILLILIVL